MTAASIENGLPFIGQTALPHPQGELQYEHMIFTEESHPYLALRAQQIQAESYVAEGFVLPEAVMEDGRLPEDIDKARGPHVEYHLGFNTAKPNDQAVLRKESLQPGQTYRDLPAGRLSEKALYKLSHTFLGSVADPERRIKEVGGLSHSKEGSPATTLAVIRSAIQRALGDEEIWFCTMVSPTHDKLVSRMGAENLKVLGDEVRIDHPMVRDVTLRPIMLRPDNFYGNLLAAYEAEGQTAASRHRYAKSLLYFSEGLDPMRLGEEVRSARQQIKMQLARK